MEEVKDVKDALRSQIKDLESELTLAKKRLAHMENFPEAKPMEKKERKQRAPRKKGMVQEELEAVLAGDKTWPE